jgi:type VI secretion system protein ImpB
VWPRRAARPAAHPRTRPPTPRRRRGRVGAGTINSREDAIRALERVCEWIERNEPSNPAPLLIRRSQRLMTRTSSTSSATSFPTASDQIEKLAGDQQALARSGAPMATSSQKFIARNRAPRVQIEYDVELYGAEKKVQLPFVMGVLSDLSGKPSEPLPPVPSASSSSIDVDNFERRMKAMKPRVAFPVPNTLTSEGNLASTSPSRAWTTSRRSVARKVDGPEQLLEARQQLANLLTYMDGKTGAEELIAKMVKDEALLKSLPKHASPLPKGSDRALTPKENDHG